MYDTLTLERYAEVLFWALSRARTAPYKKSDIILVNFDIEGLALAEEVCSLIHDRGMIPVPRMNETPRMQVDKYTKANNKRLTTLIPGQRDMYNHLNGSISIYAPASLGHLASIDPELIAMHSKAQQPLRTIMQTREDMGTFSWTLCMYPTQALAAQAGITIEEYAQQIKQACYLTKPDPTYEWRQFAKQVDELTEWLNSFGDCSLHIESESVDLSLRIGQRRTWVGFTGRNIPSFELYVSPDMRHTNGVYKSTLPTFRSGNIIGDIQLIFKDGRATKVTTEHNQMFVEQQLNQDTGAAFLGEFALVDKRFSPISAFMANTLYDENHGGKNGSMHIALGNSYSNTFSGDATELTESTRKTLGFNSSALHWDLVNTEEKRVVAIRPNGTRTTIYEKGQFAL
ncbi:aminopeptidase [Halodesulfovibrio spirochaetisodalis]|uniref:Peptidase M29 n=1 Tax=Halodesulfovibrio spirochaetisodalis TaxID=1560234 RepID=A0A1B7XBY7_9BACT|nr:aminopeptidase [Halodesulfovibrio spirochaetisodalis]OBQ50261.1 peptidase M29 [Halodesulfovibrio spirochaetisodalis]